MIPRSIPPAAAPSYDPTVLLAYARVADLHREAAVARAAARPLRVVQPTEVRASPGEWAHKSPIADGKLSFQRAKRLAHRVFDRLAAGRAEPQCC